MPLDTVPYARRQDPAAARASGLGTKWWPLLAIATALPLALLVYRFRVAQSTGNKSLPWDLFLAWVPVPLAWLLHRLAHRPLTTVRIAFGLIPLAMGWLLFFPNSPYLVTELIHLYPEYWPYEGGLPDFLKFMSTGEAPHRPPVWVDLLLFTSVSAAGIVLTMASTRLIHATLLLKLGRRSAVVTICGLFMLASFGVSLGRFDRFNSWDVFQEPEAVFDRIGERIMRPKRGPDVVAWTAVLGTMLSIGYLATTDLPGQRRRDLD